MRSVALRTVGLGVAGLSVGFAAWNPGDGDVVSTIAASVGVSLVASMVLGSLYLAVLGRNRVARWAIRGALVSFVLFAALGHRLPETVALVLGAPGMIGLMWGAAGWWLEARELRHLAPALALAVWDEREGVVHVFEGSMFGEGEDAPSVTLEVLPHSRLILGKEGWSIAEVLEVAEPPSDPNDTWPSPDLAVSQPTEGVWRERPMTADERRELRRFRRRHSWRGVGWRCFSMWVVAQIVTLACRGLGVELGTAGWVLLGLILLALLVLHVVGWRRLGQDLDRGVVLRVWDRGTQSIGDVPVGEFLPRSGWSWSESGRPAAWRT